MRRVIECPCLTIFRIIVPNRLHFERHRQGWYDIDPTRHRLIINGMVENPKVCTTDDVMGLKIKRVDVSADGGRTWRTTMMEVPTISTLWD